MRNIVKSISTQININAPTKIIWTILIGFSSYKDWNPFVTRIEGTPVVGNKLSTTISPEGKKPMDFSPTVLVNNQNQEFRWVGHLLMKGVFDGEHYFKLESIDENTTRFIHGENFSGLLVGPLFGVVKDSTTKGFEDMNKALKVRAEKQSQLKSA